MAYLYWRGDSPAVAQVDTLTPGTVAVGDTFTVTINGKSVSYTTAAGTAADVCIGLQAALSTSTIPEFQEVAWTTNSTTTITGTANTAGKPFTQTSSASGTGSPTLATSVAAGSGPADASVAANYSTGSLPANGDTLVFTQTANHCLYNLTALSGVTLDLLQIDQSFTGDIGLPPFNESTDYLEYRPLYLQVGATQLLIGSGTGIGRIKIDTGTAQTAATILNSGSPADNGVKSILWKGTHAANTVGITKGSFAAAYFPGELATIATLTQGWQTQQAGDTDVLLGAGCTLGTINKSGGALLVNASFTTLNHGPGQQAGNTYIGGGTPGTISCTGGYVGYRTTAAYTAATVGEKGTIDLSQATGAGTGTNTTISSGGTFLDPNKYLTFTNPILLSNCGTEDVTMDLGINYHLQRS